jgi:ABC-type sugar transport system ATPase subunit
MDDQAGSLLQLVDRLGKLEGLIIGLQTSIGQSQQQTTAFMARVERLEARQVELERSMITKDDISSLAAKVDALATNDARHEGTAAAASWSISNLAQWAAVVIALLALVGVGIDRIEHPPTPAEHPAAR